MNFSKYVHLARIEIIDRTAYFWDNTIFVVFVGLILFVFMHIWNAIYAGRTTIEGFTIPQMIWYLGLAELIFLSTGSDFIEKIGDDIRSGLVANSLLKPLNYVMQEFSIVCGKFIYMFVIGGIVTSAIAYFLVGGIEVPLRAVPLIMLTIFCALILNFLIIASIGLLAFWFEDVRSLYLLYQKTIFILGGMLVPLDVYPEWIKGVIAYLPFSFIMYLPSKLFVQFTTNLFLITIVGQLFWVMLSGIVLVIVYRVGIKKVSIHGG